MLESDIKRARKACEEIVVAAAASGLRISARAVRALAPGVASFRELVRDGSFVPLEPEVTRDSLVLADALKHKGVFVSPRAKLALGSRFAELTGPMDLSFEDGDGEPQLPRALLSYLPDSDVLAEACSGVDAMAAAARGITEGLEAQWGVHQRALAEHWSGTRQRLVEIVESSIRSKGLMVRRGFRSKMAKALSQCGNVLDEEPEFLLRVMQIQPADLSAIAKVAAACESDLIVATADDVRDVLNEIRVRQTMES